MKKIFIAVILLLFVTPALLTLAPIETRAQAFTILVTASPNPVPAGSGININVSIQSGAPAPGTNTFEVDCESDGVVDASQTSSGNSSIFSGICASAFSTPGSTVTLTGRITDSASNTNTNSITIFIDPPAPAGSGLVPCGDTPANPCTLCHLFELVNNIIIFFLIPNGSINNLLPLVPILASLLIAIGGFFMLTSAANPQGLQRGRTIIFAVVVGVLITYGSWLFIGLLFQAFGVVSFQGGLPWNQIQCGN